MCIELMIIDLLVLIIVSGLGGIVIVYLLVGVGEFVVVYFIFCGFSVIFLIVVVVIFFVILVWGGVYYYIVVIEVVVWGVVLFVGVGVIFGGWFVWYLVLWFFFC